MSKKRTVIINDRYRWKHPLRRELKRGLCTLWNTKDIHFKPIDGSEIKSVKYFRTKPRKTQHKGKSLWKIANAEKSMESDFPIEPVKYKLNPINVQGSNHLCSTLQQRYLTQPSPVMDTRMKRYFRALCILEYEHDHGLLTDNEFGPSMVGESCWTPTEKKRFFLAIERCGKNNIKEIARRVGPTKTEAQVYELQHTLEEASKSIGQLTRNHLTAREMSPIYIAQEEHMASLLQETLEVETFGKNLQFMERSEHELFELWNMSSLTRVFGKTNDMTLLSSSTINFYQLIKHFLSDIIIELYTQLLNSKDNTVSKALVNATIAKRNKQLKQDRRFKNLDIMAMLDKRYFFHEPYSRSKSISYLAKRRRTMVDSDQESGNSEQESDHQRGSGDQSGSSEGEGESDEGEGESDEGEGESDEGEGESDEGEGEFDEGEDQSESEEDIDHSESEEEKGDETYIDISDEDEEIQWHGDKTSDPSSGSDEEDYVDNDDMSCQINAGDAIPGIYVTRDEDLELKEAIEEDPNVEKTIGIDSSDEGSDHEDSEEELAMKRLDLIHEKQLMDYLEFYDEEAIINANESNKRRRLE